MFICGIFSRFEGEVGDNKRLYVSCYGVAGSGRYG